jgi:hypothetical protein
MVNLSNFDAESAKNFSLVALGGSVFVALLVLKFAKSIVTKLILLIVCGALGWAFFSQRDSLNSCIDAARAQASSGSLTSLECEFFGRSLKIDKDGASLQ